MVFAVLLFPTEPLSLLAHAERRVLRSLADTLEDTAGLLTSGAKPRAGWLLARRSDAHTQLALLDRSRATARISVRIAPCRWHLRAVVASEIDGRMQIDTLVDSIIALARATTGGASADKPLTDALQHEIAVLGNALWRWGNTEHPWPAELLDEVRAATDHAVARVATQPSDVEIALGSLLDTTAVEVATLTGVGKPLP